jgi:hypothetical protein
MFWIKQATSEVGGPRFYGSVSYRRTKGTKVIFFGSPLGWLEGAIIPKFGILSDRCNHIA